MSLFTFIMEYAGGTYVSQVDGPSLESACNEWTRNLDGPVIDQLGSLGKESLIEQMNDELPVQIDGLINTWCATATIQNELVLINIVKTESGT